MLVEDYEEVAETLQKMGLNSNVLDLRLWMKEAKEIPKDKEVQIEENHKKFVEANEEMHENRQGGGREGPGNYQHSPWETPKPNGGKGHQARIKQGLQK